MGHTNALQHWSLILEIMASPHMEDISPEMKETLSELFLESVHQVLTGVTTKVRRHSRNAEIDLIHHKLIADEIYTTLMIMLEFRRQPVIAKNILKIAVKVKPEYLNDDHIKAANKFLLNLLKFFAYWTHTDALDALLDFLILMKERVPRLNSTSNNVVEDLKKYVSVELYKSFKSRDRHTLVMARKTAITFSKFDLNDHIEWSKLLVSWDIIEYNEEYLEDVMKGCHWSLIWKIRRLSSAHISKEEQNNEVSSLIKMSTAFFLNCSDLMGNEDRKIKFKVFERICETYLAFNQELENISKQIRALGELTVVTEEAVQNQITSIFELSVATCEVSVVQKYAMYIVNMAFLNIIPMECISTIFKYYYVHFDTLGKLIETVLSVILERNENWVPMLLVNTILNCFEKFRARHGVLDVRSQEVKDILSLSKKFAECKTIKTPKIASKLLFYAINYVVDTESYEFLVFVRVFIQEILGNPDMRAEILAHLKNKLPKSHVKNDAVLYFGRHLTGTESKKTTKTPTKRGRPTKNPKLNIQVTKVKKTPKDKENVPPTQQSQTTDSEEGSDDDMTIHDSSSDDLDEHMSGLNVSHRT